MRFAGVGTVASENNLRASAPSARARKLNEILQEDGGKQPPASPLIILRARSSTILVILNVYGCFAHNHYTCAANRYGKYRENTIVTNGRLSLRPANSRPAVGSDLRILTPNEDLSASSGISLPLRHCENSTSGLSHESANERWIFQTFTIDAHVHGGIKNWTTRDKPGGRA